MSIKVSKSYLISAGEFSGDLIAADLVQALKSVLPDITPYGIVGETMLKAGVSPLANISELSVMGVLEVAKRLVDIRMLEQRILSWVDRTNPSFAVLVDFPGFHFRIAEQLHLRQIPVYQYVAPKVWAWGKSRVSQLRDNFAGVLGVLPFEEEFFLQNGVHYTYVGSPHFDRMSKIAVKPEDLGFPAGRKVIAFLPGSRMSELKGILPVMERIRREIIRQEPDTICVIPLASGLNWDDVSPLLGGSVSTIKKSFGWEAAGFHWLNGCSLELMKVANSVVVASGTATLECALAGTPMSVVYVMNDLSFAIAKRVVDLKWVSLVNLLMNQEVVKEHIQIIDPAVVADEVLALSVDSVARRKMLQHFEDLTSKLRPGASETAAQWIANDIQRRGQKV
jgi:lipid-A-disaccharide synthase